MKREWIYFFIIGVISILGAGFSDLKDGTYNKIPLIISLSGIFTLGLWGGYYHLLDKIEKDKKKEVKDAI